MIKWLSFGKSLKQLFIISLISCFTFGLNCFASSDWLWNIYNVDEEFSVPNATVFTNKALSSSAGILQGGGMLSKPLFLVQGYLNQFNTNKYRTLFYWDTNNELNYLCNTSYSLESGFYNLQLYRFINFARFDGTGFMEHAPNVSDFSRYGETISVNSFYNNVNLKGALTRYSIGFNTSSNSIQNAICFVYDNLGFSICGVGLCSDNSSYGNFADRISVPVGATLDPVEFNTNLLGTSPRVSGNVDGDTSNNPIGNPDFEDGYNYSPIDTGDIVFYFENAPQYKFDENVCYVGLDSSNFDILYDTGNDIAFMRGNDYGNIFDLFSYFFGNTFTTKDVGTFINAWDLNYDEYYNYAERGYNSYYSLSSGFYQVFGDNLENPFIGNSLGLFFMSFNVNKYGSYNTIGEQIATYCYYKLGLDENSDLYNITDNSDSSYWNNAGAFIDNRNRSTVYFSGSDSIVSQSWNGSVMDYFTGDDNLDFSNFFSKSFNMFKDKFTLNPNDLGIGFLPSYICLFLMALIIFRFLSH